MRYIILTSLMSAVLQAALPHHEEIATGVWAAGFSAKHQSATCGWFVSGSATVLIDPPRGLDAATFLADVARLTGKPVR
jgi:hypothetical protein